jgi:sugar lactone lactonase YvrE
MNTPKIDISSVQAVGEDLRRPESVVVTAKGEIFVSDQLSAVRQLGQPRKTLVGMPEGFLSNGIALTPERDFLIANLSPATGGGIWRIDAQHHASPLIMEVEGQALSNANFVTTDLQGRIWISASTRLVPRERAFNAQTSDGFIAVIDRHGARIVADGISFTNECRMDPTGQWVYVNETYGRRLSRFRVLAQDPCQLGPKEVVHQFSDGDFPDGLAFDAEGGVWVACVVSNRIVRIVPGEGASVMLADADPALCATADAHYAQGFLTREDIDAGGKSVLGNTASVAFGGPDLRTVYLGNLANSHLCSFRSPIAGAEPAHWRY